MFLEALNFLRILFASIVKELLAVSVATNVVTTDA